jgi:indole-3-glycerol phosphate synthase/phosphoribosylanthranilate isomerase
MSRIDEIVKRRRERIQHLGHEMGVKIPKKREVPVTPFGSDPLFICEIKRASPSKGKISSKANAVVQAGLYRDMGVKTVSVLTEEEYFSGSLHDLVNVKKQYPDLSVLRKDFLISEEDIDVSYRAGADAVLLIASMHNKDSLYKLYKKAQALGIEVLLEVHDQDDIDKARNISPRFTGFNSRDLKTFMKDLISPVRLRHQVTWNTTAVFESGITTGEHALFALSSGFSGILVGEAVMKNRKLIPEMQKHFKHKKAEFWLSLYEKQVDSKPLVKICGITNERDAEYARKMGADIIGFIFASSPRQTGPELLRRLRGLDILKVAVVVQKEGDVSLNLKVKNLLEEGLIDAVQFHGDENAQHCYEMAFPYYKALRIQRVETIEKVSQFRCPRVLLDSFVPGKQGGTGQRLSNEVLEQVKKRFPLWLAGGIDPENVREIVTAYRPELVDASSGLEVSPGKKSHEKMKTFFQEITLE